MIDSSRSNLDQLDSSLMVSNESSYSRGAPGHGVWPGLCPSWFLTPHREETLRGSALCCRRETELALGLELAVFADAIHTSHRADNQDQCNSSHEPKSCRVGRNAEPVRTECNVHHSTCRGDENSDRRVVAAPRLVLFVVPCHILRILCSCSSSTM